METPPVATYEDVKAFVDEMREWFHTDAQAGRRDPRVEALYRRALELQRDVLQRLTREQEG